MFITLRSSGGQTEAGGMEQVARRHAGPGGAKNRVRSARRPACVACQAKKLRCTGSPRNCDRCQARLIECVSPTNKQRVNDESPRQRGPSHDSTLGDGATGPNADRPNSLPQPSLTTPATPDGDVFDFDFVDGVAMDSSEFSRDGEFVEVRPDASSINCGSSDTHQPNNSPQDVYGTRSCALPQVNFPVTNTTTPDQPTIPPTQSDALLGFSPVASPSQNSQPPCSCLSDLVRVVQQLDDDEFHITTMSLDQVLQLQKWLVFQCCKPLDCPNCLDLPTLHTVRLILCDRLTEMFECIHLRIKRAGAIILSQTSSQSSGPSIASTPSPSLDSSHSAAHLQPSTAAIGSGPLPAQLFCGSSGRAANTAACNPLMFSDDFRAQYSDEEQVHMIRVLLRLQMRNFQKLLLRVQQTGQVAASTARQAKVRSMMVRLAKAVVDIEGALRVVFQGLAVG